MTCVFPSFSHEENSCECFHWRNAAMSTYTLTKTVVLVTELNYVHEYYCEFTQSVPCYYCQCNHVRVSDHKPLRIMRHDFCVLSKIKQSDDIKSDDKPPHTAFHTSSSRKDHGWIRPQDLFLGAFHDQSC